MQDTLDITGAGYEYDFMWLYTSYSILVEWKDKTQQWRSQPKKMGEAKCLILGE